jgi:hypothetical protein
MIYIEEADLYPQIKADNLTAIIQDDTTLLDTAELNAIATVTTYLYELYDTEVIFSAIGDDRHRIIVNMIVKLMLHELYMRLPKLKIPEHRAEEKREVITMLERVCDAKQSLPIPKKIVESEPATQIRWGSHNQRNP